MATVPAPPYPLGFEPFVPADPWFEVELPAPPGWEVLQPHAAAEYAELLFALLPPGRAWPRERGTVMAGVVEALAEEFARIDARALDLFEEGDPGTTAQMFGDWERAAGLPDPCIGPGGAPWAQTLAERRHILLHKVTRTGGQSRQFYIDLAARAGIAITITEFRPWSVLSGVDEPLADEEWRFAWKVSAAEETVRYWSVQSEVTEPLASWGNELLECLINRAKPAHTHVIFAYGES